MVKGICEVFERNKCLGCYGLEYDIDKIKNSCDIYKQQMKLERGNQIKFWEEKNE